MLLVLIELMFTLVHVLYHVSRGIITSIFPFLVPKKDISGQWVLVTGAGQGIGALLAKRIANLGAKLVLWDVNAGFFIRRFLGATKHLYKRSVGRLVGPLRLLIFGGFSVLRSTAWPVLALVTVPLQQIFYEYCTSPGTLFIDVKLHVILSLK